MRDPAAGVPRKQCSMTDRNSLPLGICVLPAPTRNAARTVAYPDYVHEIAAHAGLAYDTVTLEELPRRLEGLRILVTVGEAVLPDELKDELWEWVRLGGAWISIAGLCGLSRMFGAETDPPAYSSWGGGQSTLGEGYLKAPETAHPSLAHLQIPLHFFNGLPVRPAGAAILAYVLDAHGRPTQHAAVLENTVGRGRCFLIAPDLTGAVVRIQQGICVTRDGVPAPDGTGPLTDDVLKTGDGGVLDWLFDRQPVDGVPGLSAFLQPVADQWRELLLRALFHAAAEQGTPLPLLWLYPRGVPALGHISHDTDGNDPEKARKLLEVLTEAQARSTWCTILPGYSAELLSAIREGGHELAMHYDAMSPGTTFDEASFDAQWRGLVQLFGGEKPVTNKNHYLRWEGDTELFDWCAARGVELEQSKGASKTGEAGFNFGTCQPYFPLAPDGRTIDVLELPTPTQDLLVFAPEALAEPLLAAAARHHGILHLLFHPAHIDKPGVAAALVRAVERGRERGLEWWTGAQINAWERARRTARWSAPAAGAVRLTIGEPLSGATLLFLNAGAAALALNGDPVRSRTVERWGFRFHAIVFDGQRDSGYTLTEVE